MSKAREDFEKWFVDTDVMPHIHIVAKFKMFDIMPVSFQWGVWVDFYDSVGIIIGVGHSGRFYIYIKGKLQCSGKEKTRPEARKAALEKAEELYNLNNKK